MPNLPWVLLDGLINIVLVGALYVPFFAACCVVAALCRPRTSMAFLRRAGKITLFFAVLLLVGAFFSCVWGNTIWGWLYLSTDYCGMDFVPVLPIGRGAIDDTFGNEPHGLLRGTTFNELRLIWACFAAATWVSTIWIYGRLSRWWFQGIDRDISLQST